MGFKQVPEPKNGALVGQVVLASIQADELAKHGCVVQRFLHRRVREVEPLLQELDTQHGLDLERRTSTFGAGSGCTRCDQRHQLRPGHDQVHLVEELALARPLGLALESALTQAQLLHDITVSHRAMGAEVVQTFLKNNFDLTPFTTIPIFQPRLISKILIEFLGSNQSLRPSS